MSTILIANHFQVQQVPSTNKDMREKYHRHSQTTDNWIKYVGIRANDFYADLQDNVHGEKMKSVEWHRTRDKQVKNVYIYVL